MSIAISVETAADLSKELIEKSNEAVPVSALTILVNAIIAKI